MRIFVVIASLGRPATLIKTVDRLADQTRPADEIILSVTRPDDVAGIEEARVATRVIEGPKGLCNQRNAALDAIGDRADVVVFFDDDFVPANDYLEQVEQIMTADPGIVGLTGELVDDGIHGEPILFEDAVRRLDVDKERPTTAMRPRKALYGCNMVIDLKAAAGLRFDENLPLYAWQEDDKPRKENDHAMDDIRYFCMTVLKRQLKKA